MPRERTDHGCGPTEQTLLERDGRLSPRAERVLDALLYCGCLAMLHFTLDVLAQNQFAVAISWWDVATRAVRAFHVFVVLFYVLHPHASDPTLVPGLPGPWQGALRQALFFAASAAAGCYLVHITNAYGYYAVIKQAPPVACLWVWAVMELDLPQAVLSLLVAGAYMRYKG
ncbi:hypothetical protein P8C59_002779 [Phyllachora maydis]|uniref:DUF7719 domain-containing protein n=1 Tax=Phyllachora maydis TaxID=1825666 RepID=A0AAD9MCN2_9PEZI|nr:hypothetical protein P8C59_002779 [Phyllachora maydis]